MLEPSFLTADTYTNEKLHGHAPPLSLHACSGEGEGGGEGEVRLHVSYIYRKVIAYAPPPA